MDNVFSFVNDITFAKKNIYNEDTAKVYNPFIINMSLSYYPDTVLWANDMNMDFGIPNKAQNLYFLHTIRPKRRFSPWAKPVNTKVIEDIQKALNVNKTRAMEIFDMLDDEQKKELSESE